MLDDKPLRLIKATMPFVAMARSTLQRSIKSVDVSEIHYSAHYYREVSGASCWDFDGTGNSTGLAGDAAADSGGFPFRNQTDVCTVRDQAHATLSVRVNPLK